MSERSLNNTPAADPAQYFQIDHLKADLKGKSIRGGATTLSSQILKYALQVGANVLVSRLLTPQDYGLVAMVNAFTGFIHLFKDMGLSTITIQKPEINHDQVSTLFWLNIALSVISALLTVTMAPILVWFYGDPRLIGITLVLSVAILISGFSVQHSALLTRQMRYADLAIIDITSLLVSIVTAFVLAIYGAGYWALVFMQLVLEIANVVGVWVRCPWRPRLAIRRSNIHSMLTFGGHVTGFSFLQYLSRIFDNILVGKYAGAHQLGLYAKAYQLLLLPVQQLNAPIRNVALPALSQLQSEPEQYRAYYCRTILSLAALGMPLVAFLFVVVDKLILLLLGQQWLGISLIFQVLAPAAFVGTFNIATELVYLSLGRPDRQFRWGIVASTMTVLGFAIGIHWGAVGVAAAFSIVYCGVTMGPFAIIYCFKYSPLKIKDLIDALSVPAFTSVAAGALLFGTSSLFPLKGNLSITLIIDFIIYVLFYILLWVVLPNGRQFIREILSLIKEFRRKRQENDNIDA